MEQYQIGQTCRSFPGCLYSLRVIYHPCTQNNCSCVYFQVSSWERVERRDSKLGSARVAHFVLVREQPDWWNSKLDKLAEAYTHVCIHWLFFWFLCSNQCCFVEFQVSLWQWIEWFHSSLGVHAKACSSVCIPDFYLSICSLFWVLLFLGNFTITICVENCHPTNVLQLFILQETISHVQILIGVTIQV